MIKHTLGRRMAAFFSSALSLGLAVTALAAPKYESGVLTTAQPDASTWHPVAFATTFAAPPVVVLGPATYNDTQALTTRVRNVTATGFEYQLDEWDYLDGVHGSETISYLALDPGVNTIGGLTWQAGRTSGVTKTEKIVSFSSAFTAAPVVLAQVETTVNSRALTSRVRSVTTASFGLRVITQEADTTAVSGESVGWVAVATGTGTLDGAPFLSTRTGASVTQAWKTLALGATYPKPLFFAQAQTLNGGDPFTIRQRNLSPTGADIFLQEEQSAATETNHVAEDVGYLVLGESVGEVRAKLELGELIDPQPNATTWNSVTFAKTYTNPVVVFGPATQNDGDPVRVRVRNVTSTGFEWQFDEWDYEDGVHAAETVHYIAAEAGSYVIDGLVWQFGSATGVTNTAAAKTFAEAFSTAPVVLAQVVTTNEASAVSGRLSSITATGFTVQVQEEDAANQTHAAETVDYLAVQKGSGRLVSSQLVFEANASATNVTDAFRSLAFARKLAAPYFIADLQTKNDADPSVLRYRRLGATGVDVRVQEETSLSNDTTHGNESVGYLVVSDALDLGEDGLPDAWEVAHGLNPNNPADAALDSDGDGVSNLLEYAAGTDPQVFTSGGTVTAATLVTDAYEKEGTSAVIRISRTGGTVPVTVYYTLSGLATPPGTTGADYATTNSDGTVISGSVTIAVNETYADVIFQPVLDTLDEYPENAVLTINANSHYTIGTSGGASVNINDAAPTAANEQLYVAFLSRQGTAQTYASGVGTLYLNGPKNSARVNLSFSNLTSNQTNAYLRYGVTSGVGQELRPTLPFGQVVDQTWSIVPVASLTGQNIVDALLQKAGHWVYVNVGTGNYPVGEISGIWTRQTGSSTFTAPAAPPGLSSLTGDDLTRDVSRFLTQATFGATQADIPSLVNQVNTTYAGDRIAAYTAWINAQWALNPTRLLDYTQAADAQEWALRGTDPINYTTGNEPRSNNRRRGWWLLAAKAQDQLRQRAGFALSELFVTSDQLTELKTRHYGLANYYDLLTSSADGSYRTLLENLSKSPIVAKYLSSLQNQKTVYDTNGNVLFSPDENYAREILQLFSIGLVNRFPDGTLKLGSDGLPIQTYSNTDVTNLARVFTGWSFSQKNGTKAAGYPVLANTNFLQGAGPAYFQASWTSPLINFAAYHDTDAKTVLGSNIAAGLNGQQDLTAALDIIYSHPNVGPFISRQLIQRLVTSNPSSGYVYRVAQQFENDGTGVRGSLKAVIKAILLDYEARSLDVVNNVGYGKEKEPIVRYVQLIRAIGGQSQIPLSSLSAYSYPSSQLANFPTGTTLYRYPVTDAKLGQTPQSAPSVFNWFLPDFNPGGALGAAGLVAPETEISTESSVIDAINYHYQLAEVDAGQGVDALYGSTNPTEDNITLDRTPYEQIYDSQIAAGSSVTQALTTVLDQLDVVLTAGNFRAAYASAATPNPRSTIITAGAALAATTTTPVRVKELVYLLITSPEFIAQK